MAKLCLKLELEDPQETCPLYLHCDELNAENMNLEWRKRTGPNEYAVVDTILGSPVAFLDSETFKIWKNPLQSTQTNMRIGYQTWGDEVKTAETFIRFGTSKPILDGAFNKIITQEEKAAILSILSQFCDIICTLVPTLKKL